MLAVILLAILGFLSSGKFTITINSNNDNSTSESKKSHKKEDASANNARVTIINTQSASAESGSSSGSSSGSNAQIDIKYNIKDALANISKIGKVRLGLYSILTIYSIIQARLIYLVHELNNKDLWSFWKDFKSVEDLYNIDKNELLDQLRVDICKKYLTTDNLTSEDCYESEFLKDVKHEKDYILSYLNLITLIKKFKLGKLFLLDKIFEAQIRERKLRLAFVESVLLNWIAGCKITKSKKVS